MSWKAEKNKPVVIVDDDPLEHDLYARAFDRLGGRWRLIDFLDGKRAADTFRAWADDGTVAPQVVLQDLYMPPFGGLEVLEFRQRHLSGWPVPFVIISTSKGLEDIALCRAAGCDDYLVKPRRYADLIATLQRVVMPFLENGQKTPSGDVT
jgi:CheY-like chemotaxis protein